MVLSLLLRLIGERGSASASRGSNANGAPTQRACEIEYGCYCGVQTPRNKARWLAVACLLAFGTASMVWLVHVSARIVSACDAQLTPQEQGAPLARCPWLYVLEARARYDHVYLRLLNVTSIVRTVA